MKFKFIFLFTAAVMLYISPSPVNFASDGDQELSLWISPLSIYFPPADPDTDPVIVSDSLVLIEITAPAGTNWRLTIAANGDLRAGQGGRIPIENISWTASPSPPFINGVLSSHTPLQIAEGQGPTTLTGEMNFQFQNNWDYLTGLYTQTITITLTSL